MISNWLSAALARRNIHYGWVMVGVTFLTAVITAGTVGAPGVFIVPLQNEFGWTTVEISSALSIRFILFGLMAPFAAALLNRYGLRNVTLSALLVVASGLVASLFMTQVWQLMLPWGVVIGLGTGLIVKFAGGPGARIGSASRANSHSSERVLRGSMTSSTQNRSAERNGERSLLRRSSISPSLAFGSFAASMSAR